MATFTDDSIPEALSSRIRKVQYEPEPTPEQYFNPIKPNLRRTPAVQSQQMPVSQLTDKYTQVGIEREVLKEKKQKAEKESEKQRTKEEELTYWNLLMKSIPPRGQVNFLKSLATGDVNGIASAISQISYEQVRSERHRKYEDRTKVKAEIAQARKVLTNLKKKTDKRKKKTITGHKGEKKDQE